MNLLAGLMLAVAAGMQEGTLLSTVELNRVESAPVRLLAGDEVDEMEAHLKPPARFEHYRPQWRVEKRSFTFQHFSKTETKAFTVIRDGDKAVGVMRSGDIMLLALHPTAASTNIHMPTERLHLDNLLGPSLPTWAFIKDVKSHGSIYETTGDKGQLREGWEVSDKHLVFIRKLALDDYSIEARFVFTVDPVFGYRIDAVRELQFHKPVPKDKYKLGAGTFTPGCYVPWKDATIYNRTVYTPSAGRMKGWANNLLCMDRCDAGNDFDWRDGGFIAYLTAPESWSACFTRQDGAGPTKTLSICNAHNDFHIGLTVPELTEAKDGLYPYRYVHRLMGLPPELSAHVWNNMSLIQSNATGLIIRIGETEDFEKQPVPLTEPARGLVWTSGEPKIVKGGAHSGEHSIQIKGRSWPNLPQISLRPNQRYRLEGWFKVTPFTAEEMTAAKQADAKRREELKSKNKPLPPEIDWDNAQPAAFIQGDYYEWSPHTGPMVEKQSTTRATGKNGSWEHVVLDFTAPAWGPFINITFVADYCTALLDDFALRPIE
jgi:hypothetical protein